MDELHANVKFLTEYLTQICCASQKRGWTIDSRQLHVDGFDAPVRADRPEASGNQKGGGLFLHKRALGL